MQFVLLENSAEAYRSRMLVGPYGHESIASPATLRYIAVLYALENERVNRACGMNPRDHR